MKAKAKTKITKPLGFVPRLKNRGLSRFGEGREKSAAINSGLKTKDFSRALKSRPAAKSASKKKVKKEEHVSKELEDSLKKAEDELEEIGGEMEFTFDAEATAKSQAGSEEVKGVAIKASKPIAQIKKGDKVKVDGSVFEVDAHEVLIDHGSTKEMAIELFDPVTDKDYQLRYFSDQLETSMELYELQEIVYVKKQISIVEW